MNEYNVNFTDKDNQVFRIRIEFRDREDRTEFSVCSQSGQGQFKPKNEAQQRLLNLWNKYHLNGMSAGTEAQDEALKDFSGDYEARREYLESKGLLVDNGYEYGTGWKYKTLPEDLEDQIKDIIADIEYKSDQCVGDEEYNELDDKEKALFKFLVDDEGLTEADALDGCTDANNYMVLTDSEADEAMDEQLESILDDCILPEMPETAQRYFDREAWKSDAAMDGRGHILASYDGCEEWVSLDDTEYYIYRI